MAHIGFILLAICAEQTPWHQQLRLHIHFMPDRILSTIIFVIHDTKKQQQHSAVTFQCVTAEPDRNEDRGR